MKIKVKHIVYSIVFILAVVNMIFFIVNSDWEYTGYPGLVAIFILVLYWVVTRITNRGKNKDKKPIEEKKAKPLPVDERAKEEKKPSKRTNFEPKHFDPRSRFQDADEPAKSESMVSRAKMPGATTEIPSMADSPTVKPKTNEPISSKPIPAQPSTFEPRKFQPKTFVPKGDPLAPPSRLSRSKGKESDDSK